jgi:hypothetical protein
MIASEHKRKIQQKGNISLQRRRESKRKCKFDEICSRFCDLPVGLFIFLMQEVLGYSP